MYCYCYCFFFGRVRNESEQFVTVVVRPKKNGAGERNLPLLFSFENHLGRRRRRAVVRRAARQHPPVGVAQPDKPPVPAVELRPARERRRGAVRALAADGDGRGDGALAGEGRRGVGGEVAGVGVREQAQGRRGLRRQKVHRSGRVVGGGARHDHRLDGRDRGRAGLERGLRAAGDEVGDGEGGDERPGEGLGVAALRELVRRDPQAVRVGTDLFELRERGTKEMVR